MGSVHTNDNRILVSHKHTHTHTDMHRHFTQRRQTMFVSVIFINGILILHTDIFKRLMHFPSRCIYETIFAAVYHLFLHVHFDPSESSKYNGIMADDDTIICSVKFSNDWIDAWSTKHFTIENLNNWIGFLRELTWEYGWKTITSLWHCW